MELDDLVGRSGTSLTDCTGIDAKLYAKVQRHLAKYLFYRDNKKRGLKLWEHQGAAIALTVAYLSSERKLSNEHIENEAALVKMPTGSGKSAVITVLCRCLPTVKRILVLTPREALTDQLFRYIRSGFWARMGLTADDKAVFSDEDGSVAGAPVSSAYIAKLLPSTVQTLVNAGSSEERLVLVGTLQALDMIRRDAQEATAPSPSEAALRSAELLKMICDFDLVIVDEGHYEPAISWSRAIREADRPTVLFSATPYRNDYKSFRVRGRFVFNQSIEDAFRSRIIRRPMFRELTGFSRELSRRAAMPISLISEDTASSGPLDPRDKADAVEFVRALVAAIPSLPDIPGVAYPKIIIRADERDKLEMLQDEIERVAKAPALTIHHAIKKNDPVKRRFNSVKAAQSFPGSAKIRFWLHQTKLLEGVDDSSFIAVAIYDAFGNARQLVQQIGRILRSSDERRRTQQEGVILASPQMSARMKYSWDNYLEFERYCAVNTRHLVTNEAALPERLLAAMPDIQYIEGQFRPRFMRDGTLTIEDIRLPASAAVFRLKGGFDRQVIRAEIVEAILNEDRFKPIEVTGLPSEAICIAYYGWQSSPLLTRQFFPEWKLGVCIVVNCSGLVVAHDTDGIVFDARKLDLARMDQADFSKGIPTPSIGHQVRITRMSSSSLDMSERAIRSQASRTRSFENTFTDLLDPAMVPTSAYAFLDGIGRYLGLTRARIRDSFPEPLPLARYIEWAGGVADEFRDAKRLRNPVFDRYARLASALSPDEAEAANILLDLGDGFADFLHDVDDANVRASIIDVDYDELCADVINGVFEITIGGQRFPGEITYSGKTRRYRLRSPELDAHFMERSMGGRRSASTFTQLLNRTQSFRIIPERPGVVYANGNFYEPQGFGLRPDGTIAQLQIATAVPVLANIATEKGENLYFPDRTKWLRESQFGLFKAMADHDPNTPTPGEWGELGKATIRFDLIVCDDDGQEVGDFLAIDTNNRVAAIIHAKASSEPHVESITALEVVGRQALASLAFCSTTALPPKIADKRWDGEVRANTLKLTGLRRVFKNSSKLDIRQIELAVGEAMTNRSWSREIWIVAARLMDLEYLTRSVQKGMSNRNWQLLMYVDSLATACGRGNARLRIFCHNGSDVATKPSSRVRKPTKKQTAKKTTLQKSTTS
ncbi:DEAD/DEAH box helicase [Bradyrhizobium sp. SZCCHNR2009]|uniref:DEAD/DEAH box helicase n=1 Tax=Bradyrhizobium sp. SZCCHNR2009 TaxID=3057375 RepID=UPI0028F094AC|nr:DEAD/DEAH box helicase family protein [Bradyrhizobium sp. SZCCHNR2009]